MTGQRLFLLGAALAMVVLSARNGEAQYYQNRGCCNWCGPTAQVYYPQPISGCHPSYYACHHLAYAQPVHYVQLPCDHPAYFPSPYPAPVYPIATNYGCNPTQPVTWNYPISEPVAGASGIEAETSTDEIQVGDDFNQQSCKTELYGCMAACNANCSGIAREECKNFCWCEYEVCVGWIPGPCPLPNCMPY